MQLSIIGTIILKFCLQFLEENLPRLVSFFHQSGITYFIGSSKNHLS